MLDFIINNLEIIKIIIYVILTVILFIRTGNKKYMEELKNMIYRKENYQDKEKEKGQTFSQFKPVYRLNKATGLLEKTDEVVDVNELVNSCKDACLNALLERFMPCQTIEDVAQVEVNAMQDDLDIATETVNLANYYKEKFALPVETSIEDVFKVVNQKSQELKTKIEQSKEVKGNEKEVE